MPEKDECVTENIIRVGQIRQMLQTDLWLCCSFMSSKLPFSIAHLLKKII